MPGWAQSTLIEGTTAMSMPLDVRAPARRLDLSDPDQLLGMRSVANRFDSTPRTIDRWLEDPKIGFPQPDMRIGIRRFWRLGTVIQWEKERMARATAPRKRGPKSKAQEAAE
jgi:hypothetical protein